MKIYVFPCVDHDNERERLLWEQIIARANHEVPMNSEVADLAFLLGGGEQRNRNSVPQECRGKTVVVIRKVLLGSEASRFCHTAKEEGFLDTAQMPFRDLELEELLREALRVYFQDGRGEK